MIRLGLLGKDISHSKSQQMYEEILDQKISYTLFDYNSANSIPTISELFKDVSGLSITAPYKKHYLSSVKMDSKISKLNAINCIRLNGDTFEGTNTDYLAVKEILKTFSYECIVILGNGAMANITKNILDEEGIEYSEYYRKKDGDISSLDLTSFKNCLIINSCSRDFLFTGKVSSTSIFWDYNYSSWQQESVIQNMSIIYKDGLSLLKRQAFHALSFWNISNT
mgnify:CR=1 FL=1